MRILESHIDPISGHTYAVIVNPIAEGLAEAIAGKRRRGFAPRQTSPQDI